MRLFAGLALAAILSAAAFALPTTKDYNVAVCQGESYSENHLVISDDGKKLTFVSGIGDDGKVEKAKDPIICDVSDIASKNGITEYVSNCKLDATKSIDIVALTDGKKFVATVKHGDDMIAAIFGKAAPEADLPNGILGTEDADTAECVALVTTPVKDVPGFLLEYLKGDKANKPNLDNSTT